MAGPERIGQKTDALGLERGGSEFKRPRPDSKTDVRKDVRVRLPLSAPVQGLFGFWRGGQPSHLTTMDPNTRQLGLPA